MMDKSPLADAPLHARGGFEVDPRGKSFFNDQVRPPKWPFFGRKIRLVDIMANLGYSAFVDLAG